MIATLALVAAATPGNAAPAHAEPTISGPPQIFQPSDTSLPPGAPTATAADRPGHTAPAPSSGADQTGRNGADQSGIQGSTGNWLADNGLFSPACANTTVLDAESIANCKRSGSTAINAPIDHYGIDIHIDTPDVGVDGSTFALALQNVALGLTWQAVLYLTNGVLVALEWAFNLDPLGQGLHVIGNALDGAQRIFTQPWLQVALAIGAGLLVWNGLIRRRYADSLREAASMVGMVLVGMVLVAAPSATIGTVASWANDAGLATVGAIATGDPNNAERSYSSALQKTFFMTIEKPWAYLEFGKVDWAVDPEKKEPALFKHRGDLLDAANKRAHPDKCVHEPTKAGDSQRPCTDAERQQQLEQANQDGAASADILLHAHTNAALFLAFPPNSGERNSINDDGSLYKALCGADDDSKCTGPTAKQAEFRTETGTFPRLGGLVLVIIGVLAMLLVFVFIAFRLITAALLSVFLLCLAPIMIPIAALGDSGRQAWRMWGTRLLGAVLAKLIYSVFLGAVLLVQGVLAQLDTVGFWTQWVLVLAFWVMVFQNRQEVLQFAGMGPRQFGDRGVRVLGAIGAYRVARDLTSGRRSGGQDHTSRSTRARERVTRARRRTQFATDKIASPVHGDRNGSRDGASTRASDAQRAAQDARGRAKDTSLSDGSPLAGAPTAGVQGLAQRLGEHPDRERNERERSRTNGPPLQAPTPAAGRQAERSSNGASSGRSNGVAAAAATAARAHSAGRLRPDPRVDAGEAAAASASRREQQAASTTAAEGRLAGPAAPSRHDGVPAASVHLPRVPGERAFVPERPAVTKGSAEEARQFRKVQATSLARAQRAHRQELINRHQVLQQEAGQLAVQIGNSREPMSEERMKLLRRKLEIEGEAVAIRDHIARLPATSDERPAELRRHREFIDRQAALPSSSHAEEADRPDGQYRDYPRLAGLAGYTPARYRALSQQDQSRVREAVDRHLVATTRASAVLAPDTPAKPQQRQQFLAAASTLSTNATGKPPAAGTRQPHSPSASPSAQPARSGRAETPARAGTDDARPTAADRPPPSHSYERGTGATVRAPAAAPTSKPPQGPGQAATAPAPPPDERVAQRRAEKKQRKAERKARSEEQGSGRPDRDRRPQRRPGRGSDDDPNELGEGFWRWRGR